MALDLDKTYTINGHVFEAGKNVDVTATDVDENGKTVKTDYTQSIKDMQKQEADAADFGGHTHGVPTMKDPTAPTSGTPTRPDGLGSDKKVAGDPVPEEEQ